MSKLTTEEFVCRGTNTHHGKYDYSKVKYTKSHNKVTISCPDHGEFDQTAGAHLAGHGCPKCGDRARVLTTQVFAERSSKIHGNKYCYAKSIYRHSFTKLIITCPVHGDFEQTPSNHLCGQGCPTCAKIENSSNTQEFTERAATIHDGRYGYDKVNYNGNNTKVIITCPVHGDFQQTPGSHLRGAGCARCAFDKSKLTLQQFIDKSNITHDHKYTYNKADYVNSETKVTITCPTHGDFDQVAGSHIHGQGCPGCQESSHEKRLAAIFTKYDIPFKREYKLLEHHPRYRYDFYLPLQRVLVEFHGDYHYVPKKYYGLEKGLRDRQRRDREKEAFAKAAGLPLVVFNTTNTQLKDDEYEIHVLDCIKTAHTTRQNVYPVSQPTAPS